MDKLVRIRDIVKMSKTSKDFILPISKSAFWDGVKRGIYPQPIKLSTKVTCWKLSEIQAIVKEGVNYVDIK